MRKRQISLGMVLTAVLLAGSCSDIDNPGKTESDESTLAIATMAQSLTTDQRTLTVAVPTGVLATALGMVGSQSVVVGNGATVTDSDGSRARIASLGTLTIGQAASVGTTWGAGPTVCN